MIEIVRVSIREQTNGRKWEILRDGRKVGYASGLRAALILASPVIGGPVYIVVDGRRFQEVGNG